MTLYLSPMGNDNGSGSLTDPVATLAHAIAMGGDITVLPGRYRAPTGWTTARKPVTLTAPEPVLVEPWQSHGAWTATLGNSLVWTAALLSGMGKPSTAAVWASSPTGQPHRIPVWTHATGLETSDKWAAAVLSPANLHTRWGLYSTASALYLIPPVDGSFVDPNAVTIWNATLNGLNINGPDVQLHGPFTFLAGGLRLDALAQRCVVDGARVFGAPTGVSIYASGDATHGWVYGQDHVFQNLLVSDDGQWQLPGETVTPHQRISWHAVKDTRFDMGIRDALGTPVLVSKLLSSAESVGFLTQGGALNVSVSDCEFNGTFDGASHYMPSGAYDANADTNLTFTRVAFRNHADDSLDRSRYQNNVLAQDCTFENVGTILSPAPLWGNVTLRNCRGWLIGDQVRIADGAGQKPPGSIVKYGANDSASQPQGHVLIQGSAFWTDTPTTQGFCPDGGDGTTVPMLVLERSSFRVGSIVVNYGGGSYQHPSSWFMFDVDTVFGTPSTRPLKVGADLQIPLTNVVELDAAFRSDTLSCITALQRQVSQ